MSASAFLSRRSVFFALAALTVIGFTAQLSPKALAEPLPDPTIDLPASGTQKVVLAGGCFWGIQGVFQHVKGVATATSGYAGGTAETADYETVSSGTTGHAESVEVVYDPAQVSFGQLLKVYFQVAHNPTELNRQGPDTGTQYRSEIFFTTPEQQQVAESYIAQLDKADLFADAIVTKVEPLQGFYRAEEYHQDYLTKHPDNGYIIYNDLPKLAALQEQLPAFYVTK